MAGPTIIDSVRQLRQPRSVRPLRGSTNVQDIFGAFGEANPAKVTDTPRNVQQVKARGEPIHGKPLVVANGWIDRPNQTDGMFTLYVDQLQQNPDPSVQGVTQSTIKHSRYAPYFHVRNGWWMYSRWDPIFRFANTAMDMRFSVGKIPAMSNANTSQIPGGVIMGPYASPYRAAYQVPRFSTEPNTILPQATNR